MTGRRVRADLLLLERGLASSRSQAQGAIAAGLVQADGRTVTKASAMLDESCTLHAQPAHPWASRGGIKLAAALDAFGVDPAGRACLDLGASTGGFTDVLLSRGAASVVAVDVGRAQILDRIAADPRVRVLEGRDARALTRQDVPAPPDLLVADLSFIGLAKALPVPLSLAAPAMDLVALVKPQFEAGPARVGKGGIVAAEIAEDVAREVCAQIEGLAGLAVIRLMESPVTGGDGNREFLIHARRIGAVLK